MKTYNPFAILRKEIIDKKVLEYIENELRPLHDNLTGYFLTMRNEMSRIFENTLEKRALKLLRG